MAKLCGLTLERLKLTKPEDIVMHPDPLNRGIEIAPAVADSSPVAILDQVTKLLVVPLVTQPRGSPWETTNKFIRECFPKDSDLTGVIYPATAQMVFIF